MDKLGEVALALETDDVSDDIVDHKEVLDTQKHDSKHESAKLNSTSTTLIPTTGTVISILWRNRIFIGAA